MVEKVSAGQSIGKSPLRKAAFVNDVIDTVGDYKARLLGEASGVSGLKFPTDLVRVQNLTGADRQRGDVVQLGDDLLTDKDFRRLWFECDLPADPLMRRYAILLAPVLEDEITFAQVSGCCLARVNVGNALHTHAMPADGADELVSCFGGPVELLSDPDGTGSQEIAVRLAVGFGVLFGKADSDIAARSSETMSSGTVSIWQPSTAGVLSDSTVNDTLYNDAGGAITAGAHLKMQRESRNGLLVALTEDCS